MNSLRERRALGIVSFLAAAGLLYGAVAEFYAMAWGTGSWRGEFSFKWALAFAVFVIFCLLCLAAVGMAAWQRPAPGDCRLLIRLREGLGGFRYLAAAIGILAPATFLQLSPWGIAISGPYLRVLIWCLASALAGFVLTRSPDRAWSWFGMLSAVLLTGTGFVVVAAFADVTTYPFSLGWSEGNRLWDYSVLFGRRLYSYAAGQEPTAYLDVGRQVAGGLPFLLPDVTIFGERLWLSVLGIVPYLILGLLAFRPRARADTGPWLLVAVWSLAFLSQGPIHSPLLFCAILIAIAWQQPILIAAPLAAASGYFAEVSRFTWMFAPAMWAVMLEIGSVGPVAGRVASTTWKRALTVGLSALLGCLVAALVGLFSSSPSLGNAASVSTHQPLLLYRLLPNATYGDGILLGLVVAILPLVLVLVALVPRHWRLSSLQWIFVLLPMIAFLAVGLVVSTKIGGGGDLHNMDMFLIGLLFVAALGWKAIGDRLRNFLGEPGAWIRLALVLLATVPAFAPMMALRPISFSKDADWLSVLADVARPRDLGSLPDDEAVASGLEEIRNALQAAGARGEVLFMDQRQLLTFGYVQKAPLISDYEKKRMMDEALSANAAYFQPFYRDLAAHRFSLIISSPLRTPIKDRDYGFSEENNAWVKWVAKPVLCYYEEQDTLNDVKVELLQPKSDTSECSAVLP